MDERGAARDIRRKINEVIAYMKSLRTAKVDGQANKHTALGTIKIVPTSGKTVETASTIQRFQIVNFQNSYLNCVKTNTDGTPISGTLFTVMVPYLLRSSTGLPSNYVDGTVDWDPVTQKRTLQITISAKKYEVEQALQPIYDVDDYIFASNNFSGGTEATDPSTGEHSWIDLNVDGRAWHYTHRKIEICVNDERQNVAGIISQVEELS